MVPPSPALSVDVYQPEEPPPEYQYPVPGWTPSDGDKETAPPEEPGTPPAETTPCKKWHVFLGDTRFPVAGDPTKEAVAEATGVALKNLAIVSVDEETCLIQAKKKECEAKSEKDCKRSFDDVADLKAARATCLDFWTSDAMVKLCSIGWRWELLGHEPATKLTNNKDGELIEGSEVAKFEINYSTRTIAVAGTEWFELKRSIEDVCATIKAAVYTLWNRTLGTDSRYYPPQKYESPDRNKIEAALKDGGKLCDYQGTGGALSSYGQAQIEFRCKYRRWRILDCIAATWATWALSGDAKGACAKLFGVVRLNCPTGSEGSTRCENVENAKSEQVVEAFKETRGIPKDASTAYSSEYAEDVTVFIGHGVSESEETISAVTLRAYDKQIPVDIKNVKNSEFHKMAAETTGIAIVLGCNTFELRSAFSKAHIFVGVTRFQNKGKGKAQPSTVIEAITIMANRLDQDRGPKSLTWANLFSAMNEPFARYNNGIGPSTLKNGEDFVSVIKAEYRSGASEKDKIWIPFPLGK